MEKKRVWAIVAFMVIAFGALWFGVLSPGRGQAGTSPPPQDTLTAKAKEFAAGNEDTAPLQGTGVQTTLGQAVQLLDPGDQVLPASATTQSENVYVVQLIGSFTGAEAKTPSSSSEVPTGTTLWFMTDMNFNVLGWGLTNTAQDLSQLGSVFPIS